VKATIKQLFSMSVEHVNALDGFLEKMQKLMDIHTESKELSRLYDKTVLIIDAHQNLQDCTSTKFITALMCGLSRTNGPPEMEFGTPSNSNIALGGSLTINPGARKLLQGKRKGSEQYPNNEPITGPPNVVKRNRTEITKESLMAPFEMGLIELPQGASESTVRGGVFLDPNYEPIEGWNKFFR
jgi:hypothetical protein